MTYQYFPKQLRGGGGGGGGGGGKGNLTATIPNLMKLDNT